MNGTWNHTKQYFFFDESGDPNILGHHGKNLLKAGMVSKTFSVGFIKTENPKKIAKDLNALLEELKNDETLKAVPSIKNLENGFHANKDCAEIRREVFKLLKQEDFQMYAIVARKDESLFREKFNMNKKRLYKYLVSELIKNQIKESNQIDMYFSCMDNVVSLSTMTEAVDSALKSVYKDNETQAQIHIYVQQPSQQALLQVIDYLLWTVYRLYEHNEARYFDYMKDKIINITELFMEGDKGKKNETYQRLGSIQNAGHEANFHQPRTHS